MCFFLVTTYDRKTINTNRILDTQMMNIGKSALVVHNIFNFFLSLIDAFLILLR